MELRGRVGRVVRLRGPEGKNVSEPEVSDEVGGTPVYGLYRYVPRDGVEFLRFPILK